MPPGIDVLPAIDLSDGRLAIFRHGEREAVGAFGGDPLAAAHAFQVAGASWAHVVDMDLAFDGELANLEVLRAVASSGLRVQASGGVVTRGHVQAFLEAGAERVVLGSAAFADRGRVERLVAEFGERLLVGLEIDAGRVVPRGAAATDGVVFGLNEVLGWLAGVPVARYLVTAVERVGELSGPDLRTVAEVKRGASAPVLAAGGVATLDQIGLLEAAGVEGVVLGRAALEGSLDLADAFRIA